MPKIDPIRPTDDDARAVARALLDSATFGALAALDPATGAPSVTRIALATLPSGEITTLVSDLSAHTAALRADARASLLVGEPGDKGDPLTYPRMTLAVQARFLERGTPDHDAARAHWHKARPKARLYMDFGDFCFVRLSVDAVALNGGFGKAYKLTPADVAPAQPG